MAHAIIAACDRLGVDIDDVIGSSVGDVLVDGNYKPAVIGPLAATHVLSKPMDVPCGGYGRDVIPA